MTLNVVKTVLSRSDAVSLDSMKSVLTGKFYSLRNRQTFDEHLSDLDTELEDGCKERKHVLE